MHAPQARPQLKLAPRQKWGSWITATLLAAAVTGAAVSMHRGAPAGDRPLTIEQARDRMLSFEQASPLPLPMVPAGERAAAVASMDLTAAPAEERQAIESGSEPLTWLTLWDNWDEDGDTVEIISHGYRRTVRLTHAGEAVAVPVPEGGVINIRGVYDGGGGITVAIRTPQGQVALPIMAVGQVVGVPVQGAP